MRRAAAQPAPTEGTDPYLPGHGDAAYDIRHYDLDLEYKVDGNRLDARAVLDLVANEDLNRITLDLAGLRVAKVTAAGASVGRFSTRRGKLVVDLKARVSAGSSVTLTIRYTGSPQPFGSPTGAAGWEELEDGVIVAGQPGGAPSWFPCNDRPDNKASFRFAVTAPSDYFVVANGTLAARTRKAASTTWVYEQNEPMATYLGTVQIGRYQPTQTATEPVPITVVAPPTLTEEQTAGLRPQASMMELFVRLFGPYPFDQYTAVVTADELEIPLEAQSLSVFGSNMLTDSWADERLVAHELAHQWFGNSLTLQRWQDIWLHEGFACYAEWLWSEESGVMSADDQATEHHGRLAKLDQDLLLADPGPDLMFDDRLYKRGALALHAIRRTVGDETFFAILQQWVRDNAYSSVTTEDFCDLVAQHAGRPVGPLLQRWLRELPLPTLPA